MTASKPFIPDDVHYTKQFFTLSRAGHTRVTQEIGAPTLVWHLAFWPKQGKDPQDSEMIVGEGRDATLKSLRTISQEYDDNKSALLCDITKHLLTLLSKGLAKGTQRGTLELVPPTDLNAVRRGSPSGSGAVAEEDANHPTALRVPNSETMSFTLWWRDGQMTPDGAILSAVPHVAERPDRKPLPEDIRVRVQIDLQPDFSSVTFFIDAGKPWGSEPVHSLSEAKGQRRRRIFQSIEYIDSKCRPRVADKGVIDADLLPEKGISQADGEEMLRQTNLLYETIWRELCADFGFSIEQVAGKTDKIFANFRGLVMAVEGNSELNRSNGLAGKNPGELGHPGTFAFPRFDGKGSEANAVVKAYWPFIRRIRPEADYRDWIACGIFDWRALYITSLGAQSGYAAGAESDSISALVPAGEHTLPKRRVRGASNLDDPEPEDWTKDPCKDAPTTLQNDRPAPFRYLFLTKLQPHRKQAGRMVDRINVLGTTRLYALKNWSTIENVSTHVRIYGQVLDAATELWLERTKRIEEDFRKDLEEEIRKQREGLDSLARMVLDKIAGVWRVDRRWISDIDQIIQTAKDEPRPRIHANLNHGQKHRIDLAYFYKSVRDQRDKWEEAELHSRLLRPWWRTLGGKAGAAGGLLSGALRWLFGRHPRLSKVEFRRRVFILIARHLRDWSTDLRRLKSVRDELLAEENRRAEKELINIGAGLDEVGKPAIGGLQYRINRSRYYADMFREVVRTLRSHQIDTWWSYEQFATRGMDPAFRFIDNVGVRLEKLRTRLTAATDSIQTSAIVNQTEATRDNTFQLEQIVLELDEIAQKTTDIKQKAEDLVIKAARWNYARAIVLTVIGVATALIVAGGRIVISWPGGLRWPF